MQNNLHSPKASVIMPAYNREEYIKESIESILHQTFKDFEFIIVDDGSTDKTIEIIKSFDDSRIKLIENKTNLGVSASRNRGLEVAKGEYIVIFDSDDISLPERLETQIKFMDENPEIGVCGSWYETFGYGKSLRRISANHEELKAQLLFDNPLCHPAAIVRTNLLKEFSVKYNANIKSSVDYDLWFQLYDRTIFSNIQKVLLKYRVHKTQITSTIKSNQINNASRIRNELLHKLGIEPTQEELNIHNSICSYNPEKSFNGYKKIYCWLNKIILTNKKTKVYDNIILKKLVGEMGLSVCAVSGYRGLIAFIFFARLSIPIDLKLKLLSNRILIKITRNINK